MNSEKWHKAHHTVRNFLFGIVNREFLTFLVFVAISMGFWFVTAFNETYEKEISIPLKLVDVPQNVIITDGLPDSVRVTVKDKGYALFSYFYGDELDTVRVSFRTYSKGDGKGAISTTELQKLIYPHFNSSTKITSIKLERQEFYYNYGLSKRVPVLLDGEVKAADNYYFSEISFSPQAITVYSSKAQLDKISEVYTEMLELTDVKDTVEQEIALKKIRGVKMIPEKVKVKFCPEMQTEMTVTVPISAINLPEGFLLRTFPSSVDVKVVVGRSKMNLIKASNFKIVADYREVMKHPSDKCDVTLRTVPQGITNATLVTTQVDYLIEKAE